MRQMLNPRRLFRLIIDVTISNWAAQKWAALFVSSMALREVFLLAHDVTLFLTKLSYDIILWLDGHH
jgi:hypothetical protein